MRNGTLGEFLNMIRREIANYMRANVADPRIGIVVAVDAGATTGLFAARVQLLPEGTLTGWLPIQSSWVGNGWGLVAVPEIGAQVYVSFQENTRSNGTITGFHFDTRNPPPLGANPGELWAVHKSGSFFKLTNDGAIRSQCNTWDHTGQMQVTGSVSATENLSAGNGASGSFSASDGQMITVVDGIVIDIS